MKYTYMSSWLGLSKTFHDFAYGKPAELVLGAREGSDMFTITSWSLE